MPQPESLLPNVPVIEPKCFIRVIQKGNGKTMDRRDPDHGDDQNIGLHDLVSQPSMRRTDTTQKVTVNGHSPTVTIDYRFCPFCAYYARCHRTLNNHVWIHLELSMFCGVGDCFYTTRDSKVMILHAISEHSDVYLKSKKLTPQ